LTGGTEAIGQSTGDVAARKDSQPRVADDIVGSADVTIIEGAASVEALFGSSSDGRQQTQ
jgi:hypothetical protein